MDGMIGKRSLLKLIIFSCITLGVYGLYWIHSLARDVNVVCAGDGKKTGGLRAFFFLGIITFGIYCVVWLYMLGDRLQDAAPRYNLSFKESGGAIVLWYVLGSIVIAGPVISYYIIIKNMNALAGAYNEKADPQPPPSPTVSPASGF